MEKPPIESLRSTWLRRTFAWIALPLIGLAFECLPMTLLQTAKRITNRALEAGKTAHQVVHEAVVPSFDRLTDFLDRNSLTPQTVIDVGVAEGTPWLYERYPDARYFLVDPTPQSLPHMKQWATKLNASVLNIALGNENSTIQIRVRQEIGGSSILTGEGSDPVLEVVDVPMNRFDMVMPKFARPSLMKIDVQGAEGLVIEGMGERIRDIDCMIVETSLIGSLDGQPEIADIIAMLRDRGMVLYDIIGILRRPLDQAMFCIDAVFVPDRSPLRRDRRWAV